MFDFGLLPPEINSTRMYSGPGPESLVAAAAAWDSLAADLGHTASAYQTIIDGLDSAWQGPSASTMTAAVAPYIAWVTTSAEQAQQRSAAAAAAVNAFETAYAATVQPALVFSNREQLAILIATNLLGQNSAAIAANEAVYAEMWAQDVAAMLGYQADSAAAVATLPQQANAPQTTTGADPAAAVPAAATPGGPIYQFLVQLESALEPFNNSNDAFGPNANIWGSLASAGFSPAYLAPVMGQLALMQRSNELTDEGNRISEELAHDDESQIRTSPVNPAEAPTFPPPQSRIPDRPAIGSGRAAGFLSVPPSWDEQVRLTSVASPLSTGTPGAAAPSAGAPLIPTPIAAVNAPKRDRRNGEEILVSVKFVPDKGL
jgi:hypothetical protein